MLKMRKILSVALVVVMALSMMVMNTSALEAGKEVGFVLVADKTAAEIVPGAEVTITLYLEMADFDQLMSDIKVALLYDANVYTPDCASRTFVGDWAGYAKDATTAKINASYGTAVMNASSMTAEEKAKYNSAVMLTAAADAGLGATNKAGYLVTEDADGRSIAECTIVFNVTGDEAAIAAGNIDVMICDTVNTNQAIKKTNGSSTPGNVSAIDVTYASILANMPEGPATPVEFQKSQIRFKGITGPTSTSADYKGTFDVRTVAQITEANFTSFFTDETTAKAGITDFGFVYAAKSNVATFDVDTAKGVAEGTPATNYVKVPVTYMQHTGGNYIFTCLISNIPDADKTDGVNCLGYVCFNGTYYYFDAAASVDYGTLYTTYMPA